VWREKDEGEIDVGSAPIAGDLLCSESQGSAMASTAFHDKGGVESQKRPVSQRSLN
jgi:hypothetical protein